MTTEIYSFFDKESDAYKYADKMATDLGFIMLKKFNPKVIKVDDETFSWATLCTHENIDITLLPCDGKYQLKIAIWWDNDNDGYEVSHTDDSLQTCVSECIKEYIKLAHIYSSAATNLLTIDSKTTSIN